MRHAASTSSPPSQVNLLSIKKLDHSVACSVDTGVKKSRREKEEKNDLGEVELKTVEQIRKRESEIGEKEKELYNWET